jgi:hypothetical protein
MRKKDHVPSRMSSDMIGVPLHLARSAIINLIRVNKNKPIWNKAEIILPMAELIRALCLV